MPPRLHSGFAGLSSSRSLLRHELRVFCQNRMAMVVIVLTLFVAGIVRFHRSRGDPSPGDVCYVVYWEEDDWVRQLKRSAADATGEGLRIEVVPALELTGTDGIIRYPQGTHSIQLRTSDPDAKGDRDWIIWSWYSGSDPDALAPYTRWFWQATLEHFASGDRWEIRTSPLRPELVVLGEETRVRIDALLEPARVDAALIWMLVFFSACHLPKLSLAGSVEGRTLYSIVVTPAGWRGVAAALSLFYAILAVIVAAAAAAILRPAALTTFAFWLTMVLAAAAYLGVAFLIASFCKSVASASVGTLVYLMVSGLGYGAIVSLPDPWGTALSPYACPEWSIVQSLLTSWSAETPAHQTPLLLALLAWAVFWQLAGQSAFRRLRNP